MSMPGFLCSENSHTIQPSNKEFISDSEIKILMDQILDFLRKGGGKEEKEEVEYVWATGWQVADRVKMPEEFRQSIFKKEFFTFDRLPQMDNEKYGEYACAADTLEDTESDIFNDIANDNNGIPDDHESDTNQCCELCDQTAVFKIADTIGGFQMMTWDNDIFYCQSCAEEFMKPAGLRKWLRQTGLPAALAEIILDYCQPPFQFNRIDEPRIETSKYIDWVKFLTCDLCVDTRKWYINCNLNSKFYGHVLTWERCGRIFIGGDISQFEKDFINSLEMNDSKAQASTP